MDEHKDEKMVDRLLEIAASKGIDTRQKFIHSEIIISSVVGKRHWEEQQKEYNRFKANFTTINTYHYARLYSGMIKIILYIKQHIDLD